MPPDRLTALQRRVLRTLASMPQPGVVTGGAALAGFYTFHRSTRDLDVFWRGRRELGPLVGETRAALEAAALDVKFVQRSPGFVRLAVGGGAESCLVDLVAEPVEALEPPETVSIDGVALLVDSRHEILVNKICSLLERSEPRDLEDVRVLVESGGDLARALADAPRKDSGFSPLTLAWVLRGLDIQVAADALDLAPEALARLDAFRLWLVDRLVEATRPGQSS